MLEPQQLFGPVERDDLSAAGFGIAAVGELGLDACGLVRERERAPPSWDPLFQSLGVVPRLGRYALEGVTGGLGFDHAQGPSVRVEEVVREPSLGGVAFLPLERVLPNCHTEVGVDGDRLVVLDFPASLGQLAVDLLAGALFGG